MFWRNPIFRREFVAYAASRRTCAGMVGALGLLSIVLWTFWPRTGVFSLLDGDELFSVFMGVALAVTVLPVPAFSATAVTDERERHTLEVLFTTQLSAVEIGLGKLLATVSVALLFLAVTLPPVAVCAWTGGISPALLAKAYAVIAAAVVTYSLFGLAVSAMARRNATALWITYLGVLLLSGGVWLPAVLAPRDGPLYGLWLRLRAFSPFEAMYALNWSEQYDLALPGAGASAAVFPIYMRAMGALSTCFFLLFAVYLFRGGAKRRKAETYYTDWKRAVRRKLVFPFYLIDPLRRRKPIGRLRNPVAVVELRSKVFGHPKFIARSLSLCFIVSLLILTLIALQYGTSLEPEEVRLVAVLFQLAVIVVLAPLVASGSITEERTAGTFLLLRLTPLPAWRIVSGKLKAALTYVAVFLLSSLPVFLALAYLESRAAYWRVGAWLTILLLTTLVLVTFGLLASSWLRSTATATAVSYVFAVALCILPLSVLALGNRAAPGFQAFLLAFNPVAAAMQVTSDQWFSTLPQVLGNRLWHNNILFLSVLALAFLAGAAARIQWLFRHRE